MDRYLQRALTAIEAATRGMDSEQLMRGPERKWSAAQILEHLARAYSGTTKLMQRTLQAGAPSATAPNIRDRIAAGVVVGLRYMPSGRQAPEHTRPRGLKGEEALNAIRSNLRAMDVALDQCEQRFGCRCKIANHPVLGPLSISQWRKFHWVHTRHHMKQIEGLRQSSS